ncbi:TIGR01777 family oxidoreductase [Lysinibacillus sp. BW-2-10]|uniref:TIGR01777 family oxidoreductase n=1 Tax=Lysinibacillus sp. BW-2-10 TaxID=2590030 RepID=UPI00117C4CDF|nr:TIGR01777 family oxidoreductase [Lysinibacillus sp. BW-2-10]TSI11785.1 TIGR01777 family protein [Lysinibacillus sp. BW-2-10]
MRIVIAGGTGFIGERLTDVLIEKGHEVIILTRKEKQPSANQSYVVWLREGATPEKELGKVDIIINLAGVSINDGRWTPKHQKQIYESRMIATDELVRIVKSLKEKPSALINASAIGIYPASLTATYTENSQEVATDFLARTVKNWEAKAQQVEQYGIRTAFMRFGVVLGNEGGALPLMVLPYKLFVGGTVGAGNQWVSWVHVTDVVRAIVFAIENPHVNGPVNVTAPHPVTMKEFGKIIGTVLKRPHWLPVPSFAMKLALGEKSQLVLEGQQVLSNKLLSEGFKFTYPELRLALEDLLK